MLYDLVLLPAAVLGVRESCGNGDLRILRRCMEIPSSLVPVRPILHHSPAREVRDHLEDQPRQLLLLLPSLLPCLYPNRPAHRNLQSVLCFQQTRHSFVNGYMMFSLALAKTSSCSSVHPMWLMNWSYTSLPSLTPTSLISFVDSTPSSLLISKLAAPPFSFFFSSRSTSFSFSFSSAVFLCGKW